MHISHPHDLAIIILVRVISNFPNLNIILLHTYNLGNAIFAWSILSWIIHRNSSFDCINFVFQVWYKFLHDSWCKVCFLSFASYFKTSLLLFPNLDIKSFRVCKQYISQARTLAFTHRHSDVVFSSNYS